VNFFDSVKKKPKGHEINMEGEEEREMGEDES